MEDTAHPLQSVTWLEVISSSPKSFLKGFMLIIPEILAVLTPWRPPQQEAHKAVIQILNRRTSFGVVAKASFETQPPAAPMITARIQASGAGTKRGVRRILQDSLGALEDGQGKGISNCQDTFICMVDLTNEEEGEREATRPPGLSRRLRGKVDAFLRSLGVLWSHPDRKVACLRSSVEALSVFKRRVPRWMMFWNDAEADCSGPGCRTSTEIRLIPTQCPRDGCQGYSS